MSSSPAAPNRALIVAGACAGNLLEFYNFLAYAFFAPMIAASFFPSSQGKIMALFYSLVTFGVGFVARPLGAFVFGRYALRRGDRAALMLTFSLMALGSLLLAVTPPASQIGIWAPGLIVVARLVQGFSEGGEVGPATTMLYQAAPEGARGAYTAMQSFTQVIASFIAVSLGLVMSSILSHDALYAWGWRVPFALGLVIVPFGLLLRRYTMAALSEGHGTAEPLPPETLKAPVWTAFLVFGAMVTTTVSTYLRTFGVSYAVSVLGLPANISMIGMAIGLGISMLAIPVAFKFDRILADARILLVVPGMLSALLAVPLYRYAILSPGLASQAALNTTMFVLSTMTTVTTWKVIQESLPSVSRTYIFGILYAVAISVFGGATQPLITWFIHQSGSPMTAGYAMVVDLVVGVVINLGLHRVWVARKMSGAV